MSRQKTIFWTEEEIKNLGKMSDKALAKIKNISTQSAVIKRKELGIPANRPHKTKRAGAPPTQWSEDELYFLGKIPDNDLAKRKGITGSAVAQKRRALKIPSYQHQAKEKILTKEEIKIIRTHTAGEASRILGMTNSAILGARLRHGVRRSIKLMDYPLWGDVENIQQNEFFSIISHHYEKRSLASLTYPALSKICMWSVSRLQKWFTHGSAQQPLTIQVRHHIWLSVIFAISEAEAKMSTEYNSSNLK